MNKPYTCHHCGTVFDVLPDRVLLSNRVNSVFEKVTEPFNRIKVKCPGCYGHGFTPEQSIYVIDTLTMTVIG